MMSDPRNIAAFVNTSESSQLGRWTVIEEISCAVVIRTTVLKKLSNSFTMGCPPVRGDNPRALASGLSYVHVDKHGITILYHLHQCRPCTSRDISC